MIERDNDGREFELRLGLGLLVWDGGRGIVKIIA